MGLALKILIALLIAIIIGNGIKKMLMRRLDSACEIKACDSEEIKFVKRMERINGVTRATLIGGYAIVFSFIIIMLLLIIAADM